MSSDGKQNILLGFDNIDETFALITFQFRQMTARIVFIVAATVHFFHHHREHLDYDTEFDEVTKVVNINKKSFKLFFLFCFRSVEKFFLKSFETPQ